LLGREFKLFELGLKLLARESALADDALHFALRVVGLRQPLEKIR
jgi:hypothetical protein